MKGLALMRSRVDLVPYGDLTRHELDLVELGLRATEAIDEARTIATRLWLAGGLGSLNWILVRAQLWKEGL